MVRAAHDDDRHLGRAGPRHGLGDPALGHVLIYDQRIEPGENGCRVTFEARVEGPAGEWITRLVAPVSSVGQRRRLARLGLLAEWHARHQPSPY